MYCLAHSLSGENSSETINHGIIQHTGTHIRIRIDLDFEENLTNICSSIYAQEERTDGRTEKTHTANAKKPALSI